MLETVQISDTVTIPTLITTNEYRAFCTCTNLEWVTLGENLKTIGDETFQDYDQLKCYNGESSPIIGENAFQNIQVRSNMITSFTFSDKTVNECLPPTNTFSNTFTKSNTFTNSNKFITANTSNIAFSYNKLYAVKQTETQNAKIPSLGLFGIICGSITIVLLITGFVITLIRRSKMRNNVKSSNKNITSTEEFEPVNEEMRNNVLQI